MNFDQKTITVHLSNSKQLQVFSENDVLTGGDVFPEFQMTTQAIFMLAEAE